MGMPLGTGGNAPISRGYRPEVDISPELNSNDANFFQSLIGTLRWMVKMDRIDICCEISILSSCLALLRQGHLQQVLHIYAYLKRHHNSRIIMDPTYPDIPLSDFPDYNWTNHYNVSKDAPPPNTPIPLGKEFVIRAFVDADYARNVVSRCSCSIFIIIVNSAPLYWLIKKQNLVECSSLGSEMIAMKLCCEYVQGLRYNV